MQKEETIARELAAHYATFEGGPEEQGVDFRDDHFLRSPHIGNKHHGLNVEIGWEAFHAASVTYYNSPREKPAYRFENLDSHPI